jgi:integrase
MSVTRIKNHGTWVWRARVAYRGLRKAAFRPTREAAREAEAELVRELTAQAGAIEQAGARPLTVAALLDFYAADLTARGKSADTFGRARSTERALARVRPALLALPVSRVTAAHVHDAAQALGRDGAKPGSVNRDLRTLRAMLRRARPDFRFPGAAFAPEDDTRVRWLRPEEELLVFAAMPSPFREMARLAALTLMRQGELRTLRREMVHLDQGVVLLPRAKAGARAVVLSGEAQAILGGLLAGATEAQAATGWVFPNPDGVPYTRVHVSRVWRRAARAAGLRDFHFHDLRHHGATMALNRGFTAPIVMALGGWKTERMMRRYAAVTDQTLRAAAEAVSGAESAISIGAR